MTVTYDAADPKGLAAMIGALIDQNLARDPDRRRLLRPGVAALAASDAAVAVTLRMSPGTVLVEHGADPRAQVLVRATGERLLALAAAPLRGGLPDALAPAGRAVLADLAAGRVRIRGLLRHPLLVRRLTLLLSAA
ncbi:MAG TPA: hypothetical protein VE032_04560 [Actinomycetota bacterium]|nr:hypothetical protein [Actinomycetota bacterium]